MMERFVMDMIYALDEIVLHWLGMCWACHGIEMDMLWASNGWFVHSLFSVGDGWGILTVKHMFHAMISL